MRKIKDVYEMALFIMVVYLGVWKAMELYVKYCFQAVDKILNTTKNNAKGEERE